MQILNNINLVIASGSETIQQCLQEIFSKQGANVTLCGFLDFDFVDRLEKIHDADVILIDMDDSYEENDDALDLLLEKIDLPILFHDNDFDELNDSRKGECFAPPAVEKLAKKLAELAKSNETKKTNETESNTDSLIESLEKTESELELVIKDLSVNDIVGVDTLLKTETLSKTATSLDNKETLKDELLLAYQNPSDNGDVLGVSDTQSELVNVWVLGASIGGPESVKRFLARIPKELPVAFVLAQHLGDGFVSLLANQLDRISSFSVKEGIPGDTLSHGEVVVVPVDNRMSINEKGQIKYINDDWKGHYKPSIDCVIDDVTSSFKKKSGVIIFSGMGADGVLASQQFAERYHGNIWAQTADTCVISSMPDSVRKANLVNYSGSPEALALKISVHLMGKESYIV